MNLLKKVLWLLIISIVSLNATDLNQTQVCQAFADGIQTRTNSSKIKFINNSYLFNNPNSSLNGFKVINQNSNLSCRDVNGTTDEVCQSSNALGMSVPLISLQTPEAFTFTEAINNATHIKMKKLMVKKNKNLNLTASSAIYLERLEVAKNSTVTITAPKVVIGHLSSFQKSNIKIIADTIDIKIIKLENKADLIIESFNENAEVEMRVEKLKLKKASLLLNNGLYHIKRVELKNRSSLNVGDSVQIVNRRTVVLNHSRINASKDSEICDDKHNPNALFIYSNDLVRVENHSKIVAMVYNDRRVEFTKHAGLKGAVSAKNRAIFKNHSKVCYSKCNLTSTNTDLTPPVLTLNGNNNITLKVGGTYTELGATALDDVDGNVSVSITGSVDTSTVGVYTLTYTARDSANNIASKTRRVTVTAIVIVDTTPPVITLNGDVNLTLTQGENYSELGATAIDDVDGNVSVSITGSVDTSTVGTYTLTYTARDSANNIASKTRIVNVVPRVIVDTTPPVITLNGDVNLTLTQGENYSELVATAIDDVDGNVSVSITGSVDTSTVGTYTLIYTATDSANNSASKKRIVNVVPRVIVDTTPPVITLNGNASISITQDDIYNELGATAVDNVDGNIEVSMSGNVDTSIVGTYTIVYTAKDNANNEASLSREVIVTKKDVEYGVNIGILLGNTARFYRQASFSVSLKSQPETNVTIPLSSSDVNEGEIVGVKKLVFTPENWDETQSVFITGKNKNVGEGEQNYKVILGKIISEDANYNDLDPNDVPLKFKILSITAPKDKYDFVPTSRKVICIKVNTAIFKQNLRYKIIDAPTGMKMEEDSTTIPCVEWKAPISESGATHNVTLEVRDGGGSTKKEISFEIHVANTIPLQSEIDGDSVTITEPNSNLKGLRVTRLEPNINLEDIKFRKVVDPYLEPHGRNRISDIFIEEKLIKGKIKVTIPQVKRDDIDSLSSVSLYAQTGEYGYQGFGGSISNLLEEGRVELRGVFGVGFGHHFIGLNNEHFGKRREQKKTKQLKMFKNNSFGVICLPSHKNDSNSSLNYKLQYCSSINNPDINITVEFRGDSEPSILWDETTVEEMISWLVEAQISFTKLSLLYKNKFTVYIENTQTAEHPHALGFVTHKDDEKRNILHLHNDYRKLKHLMKGTAVHEYFHHAQGKTIDRDGIGGKRHVFTKEGLWIAEGTARWFEDYLYDDLNSYIFKEVNLEQILTVGLNETQIAYSNGAYKSYQRFAFFKLLEKNIGETVGCANFESIFPNLITFDRSDLSGIENLISLLSLAGCNFGTHLDEANISSKESSLEAALAYYQYATVLEKDMQLLDSNENNMLAPHPYIANAQVRFRFKDDKIKKITKENWHENTIDALSILDSDIPAYGAKSIKIDYDIFHEISGDANLSIRTNRPLTVIGVRLDRNGNPKADGINDNFHFTTEAGILKKYTLTQEDKAGGLFITLIDAHGGTVQNGNNNVVSASEVEEFNLTKRFSRDNITNIVTDHERGLMWQDETDTWLDSWYGAKRHCEALTLGDYDDWRVPSYDELIHILDLDGEDTYRYEIFEHLGPVGYWSLELNGGVFPDTQSAKVVNFGLATWIWINTSSQMNTRCVRTK